jgi:hypothetical protein
MMEGRYEGREEAAYVRWEGRRRPARKNSKGRG